jgi:hypothetical protein
VGALELNAVVILEDVLIIRLVIIIAFLDVVDILSDELRIP